MPLRLCTPGGRCGWQASSRGAVPKGSDVDIRRLFLQLLPSTVENYPLISFDITYIFWIYLWNDMVYIDIQYFLELCRALRRSLWFSNNSMIIHQHHSIILFDMCLCLHHIDIHLHILQDLGLRVKAVSMNLRPFTRWGREKRQFNKKIRCTPIPMHWNMHLLCLTRHCIYCYLHSVSLRTSRVQATSSLGLNGNVEMIASNNHFRWLKIWYVEISPFA